MTLQLSMERIQIPHTTLQVSGLCLGLASLGIKNNTEASGFELMDRYVELGGNFFDTARAYSNWIPGERNRSERIFGDWILTHRNRSQLIIATKGGHRIQGDPTFRTTPEAISSDLNGSLESLRIEQIDLYYLHRDDPSVPVGEIVDYLNIEIENGKIRYLGCSNWTSERINAANAYAAAHGKQGFVASQPRWSLGSRHAEKPSDPTLLTLDQTAYDFHKESGIAVIPYSSQAGGFFSKYARNDTSEAFKESSLFKPENLAIAERLRALSGNLEVDIAHLVLAFMKSRPFPVIPIVGCRTADQITDSFRGLEVSLTKDQIKEIHALDPY